MCKTKFEKVISIIMLPDISIGRKWAYYHFESETITSVLFVLIKFIFRIMIKPVILLKIDSQFLEHRNFCFRFPTK